MISGLPRLLVCALLAVVAAARAAEPAGLAGFLAGLAPPPDGPVPFVERRMSALLAAPIEVRGELVLGRDGSIDKRVTEPAAERVRITASTLTLERESGSRTVDLAGDARWRAFHAGITGLLNRDPAALDRAFEVQLEQSPPGWSLTLRPRAAGSRNAITAIRASGTGPILTTLRLEQGEGEWQEMTFPRGG